MKTTEREGVGACSLAHSTLGVEGCARIPGWGLGHKPNNKLISA